MVLRSWILWTTLVISCSLLLRNLEFSSIIMTSCCCQPDPGPVLSKAINPSSCKIILCIFCTVSYAMEHKDLQIIKHSIKLRWITKWNDKFCNNYCNTAKWKLCILYFITFKIKNTSSSCENEVKYWLFLCSLASTFLR